MGRAGVRCICYCNSYHKTWAQQVNVEGIKLAIAKCVIFCSAQICLALCVDCFIYKCHLSSIIVIAPCFWFLVAYTLCSVHCPTLAGKGGGGGGGGSHAREGRELFQNCLGSVKELLSTT